MHVLTLYTWTKFYSLQKLPFAPKVLTYTNAPYKMYWQFIRTLQKFSFAPKVPICTTLYFSFFPLVIDSFSKIPVISVSFLSLLTNLKFTNYQYNFTYFKEKKLVFRKAPMYFVNKLKIIFFFLPIFYNFRPYLDE